jgi:ATP-binding cassette subfamily B multidrug efflux pump
MPESKKRNNLKRVLKYLRRYRGYLIAGGVAIVLTNAFIQAMPWIVKNAIERLESGSATSAYLIRSALLIVFVAVMSGLFMFFLRRTIIWASRFMEYDLKNELAAQLIRLPRSFYNKTPTGDIIARLSNDVEAVRMMLGPGIMHFSSTVVTVSISLTLMLILSPSLTLVAVLPFPIIAFTFKKVATFIYTLFYAIQEHFSKMTAFVQENVAGVRVVKAYNQQESQTEQFGDLNEEYITLNLKLARLQGLFQPMIALEVGIILIVVLYFGGRQVINDTISLGVLVAFMLYLMMLVWPVMAIGWTVTLYQRGLASLKRIENILKIVPEVRDTDKVRSVDQIEPEIRFENLSFAYPETETQILKNISMKIPAGKTTAIVGRTGCGKSTVIDLIVRIYRVGDGLIFVGDRDINSIPLKDLRKLIGYVPQESFLFSDSLYQNISFGLPQVDKAAAEEAALLSKLESDIQDFPRGYDTIIGERGVTLSGGQKQRTALARAIARDPKILILDDAFSSVDTETEEQILNGIDAIMSSRTTILVSHRISTVRKADLIYVMEDGRIVGSGSHERLMTTCTLYAEMVERQELEKQLEML